MLPPLPTTMYGAPSRSRSLPTIATLASPGALGPPMRICAGGPAWAVAAGASAATAAIAGTSLVASRTARLSRLTRRPDEDLVDVHVLRLGERVDHRAGDVVVGE